MELNYSKIFNKEIINSVDSFCKLNDIDDINKFIKNTFQEGFNIKKYGLLGKTHNEGEKDLINEVIVEKRVEVPVEKIVERIVTITDDTKINELLLKIQQLENEMSKKNEELNALRQSLDIRGDDGKVRMLQSTVQNLMTEVRDLKSKNDDLNKKLLEQNKPEDVTVARFHGGSNLNDDLYR